MYRIDAIQRRPIYYRFNLNTAKRKNLSPVPCPGTFYTDDNGGGY